MDVSSGGPILEFKLDFFAASYSTPMRHGGWGIGLLRWAPESDSY